MQFEADMTIHLNVNSELERRLKKVASQMGLTPDTYIMLLLQKDLQNRTTPARLSPEESKLIKKINSSFPVIDWERYRVLLAKRDAEELTGQEQVELIAFSDQIEEANARRMKAVAELARLRKTTVPALMEILGLSSLYA
jgi:antitoxin component of RelBE/YafQ-DinJ toxin-antitoxin module